MRIIITGLLTLIFITGCYYDNEEYLFPELPGGCDTLAINYSMHIKPIIEENCIVCHSNIDAASLGGNIMLQDFSDVSAQSSLILGAVKHEAASPPMPQGSNQLIRCNLLIIEAWINQGLNEN